MRLDLVFPLVIPLYHQVFARPEIAPENPLFIHPSSSAELRTRAEINNLASPEDFIVAVDNSEAAVSNSFPDISNPSQPAVPSGQREAYLSGAAESTDRISLTGSDKDCASPSSRKLRKRQACAGKSKDDPARSEDPDSGHSLTKSESGCSPSLGSKSRKRQFCRWSSGSDEPRDDSSSGRDKRLCPRNRKTLCCRGPKPPGIYTQGCSDCKWLIPSSLPQERKKIIQKAHENKKFAHTLVTTIFDPRCNLWNINCCVYYISNAKPGSDIHTLLNDEGVGVFCYTPLFFPIQ